MEFNINKTATQPLLVMELINDVDFNTHTLSEKLENASVTFAMVDEKGIYKIANKVANIVLKTAPTNEFNPQYYLVYRWSGYDTSKAGRFEGQFKIIFHDDNTELIVPIREKLCINIRESFVKSSINC